MNWSRVFGVAGGLVGVVGLLAVGAWWWFGKPIYVPGHLAERTDLDPIGDELASTLQVAPGIALHAFEEGEGPLTVVVHGGPGRPPADVWPALHQLTEERRMLYVHQRGSGRSTRPIDRPRASGYMARMAEVEQTLGLGQQIADIERIRRLSGEEQIDLVGHSFGGFLAAMYAAEFPSRVRSLVLIAPAAVLVAPSEDADLFGSIREQLNGDEQSQFDAFLKRYLDFSPTRFENGDADEVALHEELGRWYLRAVREAVHTPAAETGGWMTTAMYASMGLRHDYRGALAEVTAPTLVLHGSEDLQPLSVSQRYADHIPGARLQVIDGAGHMPHVSHADAVASAIRGIAGP